MSEINQNLSKDPYKNLGWRALRQELTAFNYGRREREVIR